MLKESRLSYKGGFPVHTAIKGVNQVVIRFTPFFTPRNEDIKIYYFDYR